jgi:Chorismate synthase
VHCNVHTHTHRSSSSAGSHRALAAAPRMGLGNSFGRLFRISTWGESHGGGVGVTLDGCPPKLPITREDIQIGNSTAFSLYAMYSVVLCTASMVSMSAVRRCELKLCTVQQVVRIVTQSAHRQSV